jgi:mannose-1-phosphate guanylyltransferase
VLAADHAMADPEAFRVAVRLALPEAEAGRLVTFGIVPDRPETGYGYIRRGAALGDGAFDVAAFVEKPDRATAEGYLAGGEHFWNSGMFLFRAGVLIEETGRHAPEMVAACERAFAASREDADFLRIDPESFAACPANSIDYAVMEKTDRAVMVPLDAGWSDIGSFAALWALRDKDGDGNALSGDVLAVASRNSLVEARSRLVALVGVEDLVVVETGDAVLVARRERVQEIEAAVRQMKEAGRTEIMRAGGK